MWIACLVAASPQANPEHDRPGNETIDDRLGHFRAFFCSMACGAFSALDRDAAPDGASVLGPNGRLNACAAQATAGDERPVSYTAESRSIRPWPRREVLERIRGTARGTFRYELVQLTRQEQTILGFVADGLTNKGGRG